MSKKLLEVHRQGDVYLAEVGVLPEGCIPTDNLVLAIGEATGHSHRFPEGVGLRYEAPPDHHIAGIDAIITHFVVIEAPAAPLQHEEHGVITFPPGIYAQWREREWSDEDEPRAVYD